MSQNRVCGQGYCFIRIDSLSLQLYLVCVVHQAGVQVATGGKSSPNTPASFSQLVVAGAAQNINQAGQQITQKNLNLQPTIEIRHGMKLNVFVTKDMILKPYSRI